MDRTMSKTCSCCRQVKPSAAFHRNKAHADGLANWCRSCKRKSDSLSRLSKADRTEDTFEGGTDERQCNMGSGQHGMRRVKALNEALVNALRSGTLRPEDHLRVRRVLSMTRRIVNEGSPFVFTVYRKEWEALSRALRPVGKSTSLYAYFTTSHLPRNRR
jgi:hypothetical protein